MRTLCRCATSAESVHPSAHFKAAGKGNLCSWLAWFSPSSCPCGSATAWCSGSCGTQGCWRPSAFASRATAANTPSRWSTTFPVFQHLQHRTRGCPNLLAHFFNKAVSCYRGGRGGRSEPSKPLRSSPAFPVFVLPMCWPGFVHMSVLSCFAGAGLFPAGSCSGADVMSCTAAV